MIKFEKDNKIIYFKNAEEAAQWLIDQYHGFNNEYNELLEEIYVIFEDWVNDQWSAYDILCSLSHWDYEYIYNEWMQGLIFNIQENNLSYFTNEVEEE